MDGIVTTLVEGTVVPLVTVLTAPIPWLAATGILLLMFGGLWAAFAVALVRDPARIEAVWRRVRGWPLAVQAVAWVLFLPVLAGIAIWRTAWPTAARLVVVGAIAAWNLLVLLPAGG